MDSFLRQDEEPTMKNKQGLRGSQSLKGKMREREKVTDLVESDGIQQEIIIKRYKRAVTLSPFRESKK